MPPSLPNSKSNHAIAWAWLIAAGFFFFKMLYAGCIQLAPDEAYYWEWSRHLDLSYYDQGPGLALAIRLGTWLFGTREIGVRFPAVFCGFALCGLAIFLCDKILKKKDLAPWVVLAFNAMLLYAVGGVLMVHDPLQVTFWAGAVVCALMASREGEHGWWWLPYGLCAAAGLMSKYTGTFIFPSVFLALVLHPLLRRQVRSLYFWLGQALGLAGLAPIIIWNYQQHWPSFLHVASLAGGDSSRHAWSALPEFISSQFGLITPVLFYLILRAWFYWWRVFRSGKAPLAEWVLWWVSFPVFSFFLVMALRTRVEGNWPAPSYFGGLILTGLYLWQEEALSSRKSYLALGLGFCFVALAFLQAANPFLPIPESQAKLDAASRVDGWKQLAAKVEDAYQKLSDASFVACSTYQNAAEMGFYLPQHPTPLILVNGSINHQYRFWNQPEAYLRRNAVVVVERDWEANDARPRFERFVPAGKFIFFRNGVPIRSHQIYYGFGFKG